jgi:hypothetical protein
MMATPSTPMRAIVMQQTLLAWRRLRYSSLLLGEHGGGWIIWSGVIVATLTLVPLRGYVLRKGERQCLTYDLRTKL